jgi:adenylate cyclase 1
LYRFFCGWFSSNSSREITFKAKKPVSLTRNTTYTSILFDCLTVYMVLRALDWNPIENMDHSVKAMNSHRKVAFSRLFNRRRFENSELESLYQRYIFKLQQSSIISVLALFSLLTATLAGLQFYYEKTITIIGLYCLLQCIAFIGLFLLSFKMRDSQLLALCYVILLFCVLFCLIFAPVNLNLNLLPNRSNNSNDSKKNWLLFEWWNVDHRAAEGVWQIVFVTFLTYTMLPIKTRISLFIGILLSSAHITITLTNRTQGVYQFMALQQVRHPFVLFLLLYQLMNWKIKSIFIIISTHELKN